MSILGSIAGAVVSSAFGGRGGKTKSKGSGSGIGGWLTSTAGTLASSVLGRSVDRRFDQYARDDQYNFLDSKGLTPQEISGSSFGGGASSATSSVLGNQQAQLTAQRRTLSAQQRERDKDRAVAMRGQDLGLQSSQLSAGASYNSAATSERIATLRNNLEREVYANVTLPNELRRAVTESPGWKRVQIMASMGVDNIIGTAVASKYGLDPMDPSSLAGMSQASFLSMIRDIYGMQSNAFGETAGGAMALTGAVSGFGSVLGRGSPSSGSRGRSVQPSRPSGR